MTVRSVDNKKLYGNQVNAFCLKQILCLMVQNIVKSDIKSKRLDPTKIDVFKYKQEAKKKVAAFLLASDQTCSVSGTNLTIINGPRRFSLDRTDKLLPHFGASIATMNMLNINLRCRLFNMPQKVSKESWEKAVPCTKLKYLKRKRE